MALDVLPFHSQEGRVSDVWCVHDSCLCVVRNVGDCVYFLLDIVGQCHKARNYQSLGIPLIIYNFITLMKHVKFSHFCMNAMRFVSTSLVKCHCLLVLKEKGNDLTCFNYYQRSSLITQMDKQIKKRAVIEYWKKEHCLLNKWLTRLELQDEVTDPITPSPYHLAVLSNKPWLSLFFSLPHISTPQLPSQSVNRCLIKVVSTSRAVGPANFTVFEVQIV